VRKLPGGIIAIDPTVEAFQHHWVFGNNRPILHPIDRPDLKNLGHSLQSYQHNWVIFHKFP
jgi:hypothetical protein